MRKFSWEKNEPKDLTSDLETQFYRKKHNLKKKAS